MTTQYPAYTNLKRRLSKPFQRLNSTFQTPVNHQQHTLPSAILSVLVAILLVLISMRAPSNGVDDASAITPIEMLETAAAYTLLGSIIAILLRFLELDTDPNNKHTERNNH